jgi:hypothetical protein
MGRQDRKLKTKDVDKNGGRTDEVRVRTVTLRRSLSKGPYNGKIRKIKSQLDLDGYFHYS